MIKQGIKVIRLLWHVSGIERRKEGREGRMKERGERKEREWGTALDQERFKRHNNQMRYIELVRILF